MQHKHSPRSTIVLAGVEHIIHDGPISIDGQVTEQGLIHYARTSSPRTTTPRTMSSSTPVLDRIRLHNRLVTYVGR